MKLLKTALFLAFFSLVGCGQKTYEVSGNVTFDGEPISEGHIAFTPMTGPAGGAGGPITAGHYSFRVPAGKSQVVIRGSKMYKFPPGQKGMYGKTEEMRDFIPDKYNAKTELSADVTGSTTLNFDLKSK